MQKSSHVTGYVSGHIVRQIRGVCQEANEATKRAPRVPTRVLWRVAHAGFEPAISALRGRRPSPLDEWALLWGAAAPHIIHCLARSD